MKLKGIVFGVALALIGASVAFASPPTGKGKPDSAGKPATTGPGCKPSVAVILKGTLAGDGSSSVPFALSVIVTGGNHYVARFKPTASIQVVSTTKVRRQGDKKAADLKSGDRVNIQAKACRADLLNSQATVSLTATRIVAHPVAS